MADPRDASLPEAIGRYRVVRDLTPGEVSRRILARDPLLDRDVVIVCAGAGSGEREGERFGAFGRAAARVAHPAWPALHDTGRDAAVGPFLVFEHVQGVALATRLGEGAISMDEGIDALRALGGALGMAHACGLAHGAVDREHVVLANGGARLAAPVVEAEASAAGDRRALVELARAALGGSTVAIEAAIASGSADDVGVLVDGLVAALRAAPEARVVLPRPGEGRRPYDRAQVAIGAAVVVVTLALLARAALRHVEKAAPAGRPAASVIAP